jgi:hypothetical protein
MTLSLGTNGGSAGVSDEAAFPPDIPDRTEHP